MEWDGDLLRAELQAALLPQSLPDDPLVVGVDVSGGGAAWNVIAFRRGNEGQLVVGDGQSAALSLIEALQFNDRYLLQDPASGPPRDGHVRQ